MLPRRRQGRTVAPSLHEIWTCVATGYGEAVLFFGCGFILAEVVAMQQTSPWRGSISEVGPLYRIAGRGRLHRHADLTARPEWPTRDQTPAGILNPNEEPHAERLQ
jgi:hypothetical protein